MTTLEYFAQAHRLDQRINSDLKEIDELRALACSISSPGWGERINSSGPKEPAFVHSLEKIMMLEADIDREIDALVDLKEQMREVIGELPDANEQLAVKYRVLHGYTWDAIGNELHIDAKTARRWFEEGVAHTRLPEYPIKI